MQIPFYGSYQGTDPAVIAQQGVERFKKESRYGRTERVACGEVLPKLKGAQLKGSVSGVIFSRGGPLIGHASCSGLS